MSSRDQDLLDKLFEVEKKAEALVAEARAEADKRIAGAKERAEVEVSTAYEKAVKLAAAKREEASQAVKREYESAIALYKGGIDATAVDLAAFRATCEGALAKK